MNIWFCYSCGVGLEPKNHYCDDCCLKLAKWSAENEHKRKTSTLKYTNVTGYGKVLDSRIKEMEKRAIIADKSDPTGYHVGTYEGGKIHEREPNY